MYVSPMSSEPLFDRRHRACGKCGKRVAFSKRLWETRSVFQGRCGSPVGRWPSLRGQLSKRQRQGFHSGRQPRHFPQATPWLTAAPNRIRRLRVEASNIPLSRGGRRPLKPQSLSRRSAPRTLLLRCRGVSETSSLRNKVGVGGLVRAPGGEPQNNHGNGPAALGRNRRPVYGGGYVSTCRH